MTVPNFPKKEEEILAWWNKEKIFKRSLEKPSPRGSFVFFEGPPTANAPPGLHHVLSRSFKDVIPRFRTMQGYYVGRKAGWDTHGLPVELQVEKTLGFKSKDEIEKYGISRFNRKCKESVWQYKLEWEKNTERIGYWLDMTEPYITYDWRYIQTLWWAIKKIYDNKLLYEDFRVVPYCPRCETPLSTHELAQGFKETEDPSIFIKFKLKEGGKWQDKNLLVWTTTPWTLPGNVALAVAREETYLEIKTKSGENLILANSRLEVIPEEYEIRRVFIGSDLEGLSYEPPFDFIKYEEKTHYIAGADFVSLEEGTGIVHIAVMYGIEDFELGKKLNLPRIHVVDKRGRFTKEIKPWAGKFVKDADVEIIENLKKRGLLYREKRIIHSYPFCWRCQNPLLYWAATSWYFDISKIKDKLIQANNEINWEPSHIREGRMGEWLKEIRDWSITRTRYWGTPLPIWKCPAEHILVIASIEDLEKHRPYKANRYLFLRHGEAELNVRGIVSSPPEKVPWRLTDKGRKDVEKAARSLSRKKISAIYASPVLRVRETAEIVSKIIGLSVIYDERLTEISLGEYSGKTSDAYHAFFKSPSERWTRAPKGAESWRDVRRRMTSFMQEIDARHRGETILIIGHGDPLFVLGVAASGLAESRCDEYPYPEFALPQELEWKWFPRNEEGEVDLHRPYIDEIILSCPKCKKEMKRIPDIADVWFDSGMMPFAQWGYPFENRDQIDKRISYPADYISEGIDQTRGWFYTLLACSTLLGFEPPYRNVIALSHVLDKEGKKMSKSLGNVIEPDDIIGKYGADALRFYFYTINQAGDPKRFDEKDIDAVVKKTFLILWNVLKFWKLYAGSEESRTIYHILDRWLISRLHQLIKKVTNSLNNFQIVDAARAINSFINDLSTWYVRRSRERFKISKEPSVVLKEALLTLSKLMAPFTPFLSEAIYQEIKKGSSVHLEDWPLFDEKLIDEELNKEMELAREVAVIGHALRNEARIKVRQPLRELEIEKKDWTLRDELLSIIGEELNVKKVHLVDHIEEREGWLLKTSNTITASLSLEITPELREEGWQRETLRTINDLRKAAGLTPRDQIHLFFETKEKQIYDFIEKNKKVLIKESKASSLEEARADVKYSKELELNGLRLWIGIEKK